jgi:hypothetical protein
MLFGGGQHALQADHQEIAEQVALDDLGGENRTRGQNTNNRSCEPFAPRSYQTRNHPSTCLPRSSPYNAW